MTIITWFNYDIYNFKHDLRVRWKRKVTSLNSLQTFFCETIMRKMRVKPSMLFKTLQIRQTSLTHASIIWFHSATITVSIHIPSQDCKLHQTLPS